MIGKFWSVVEVRATETVDEITKGLAPRKHMFDVLPIHEWRLVGALSGRIPGSPRRCGGEGRVLAEHMVGNPFPRRCRNR
jgi:hypothetical protein